MEDIMNLRTRRKLQFIRNVSNMLYHLVWPKELWPKLGIGCRCDTNAVSLVQTKPDLITNLKLDFSLL
jgi:hypothetical protein